MAQRGICRYYLLLPKHRQRYAVAFAGTGWQVFLPGDLSKALILQGIQFLTCLSGELNTYIDQVHAALHAGTGLTDLPAVSVDIHEIRSNRFSMN